MFWLGLTRTLAFCAMGHFKLAYTCASISLWRNLFGIKRWSGNTLTLVWYIGRFIVHQRLVGGSDTKGRKRATAAFQWLVHLCHVEPLERAELETFFLNRFMTAQEVAMKVKEDFWVKEKGACFDVTYMNFYLVSSWVGRPSGLGHVCKVSLSLLCLRLIFPFNWKAACHLFQKKKRCQKINSSTVSRRAHALLFTVT